MALVNKTNNLACWIGELEEMAACQDTRVEKRSKVDTELYDTSDNRKE